ncbi:MAG: DNA repair protein RadC [Proteobacteria bacterium]|nr:DNA repair protein RadC [Pseudomonadota bacterium]
MTDSNTQPDYLGHRQRLRERFLLGGGRDMPDYELLELLLTTAIPRRDVKPIAKNLIRKFGSFARVINAPKEELFKIDGIKDSAYTIFRIIVAAIERTSWQNLRESELPVLLTTDALIDYCRATMAFSDVEELHIIYLNSKLQVMKQELMQKGTINMVSVHPREVIKAALSNKASAIILVHNHPSGNVTPSTADTQITMQIREACTTIGIRLLDHIIISESDAYSFSGNGIFGQTSPRGG